MKTVWYVLLMGWDNSRIRWYLFPERPTAKVEEGLRQGTKGWAGVARGDDR